MAPNKSAVSIPTAFNLKNINLIPLYRCQVLIFRSENGSEEKLEVNNYCLNGVLKRSWRRFAFNSPIPDIEAFSFLKKVQFKVIKVETSLFIINLPFSVSKLTEYLYMKLMECIFSTHF